MHHGLIYSPTPSELARVEDVARERVRRADGRERFAYADRDGRETAGVLGELAAARVLGIGGWFPTVDTFHEESDLPYGIEVRTRRESWHELPFATNDERHVASPYVLVVPFAKAWRVVGWAYGAEVKQDRYWHPELPYPCWLMPQDDLRPIYQLLNFIAGYAAPQAPRHVSGAEG